MNFKEHLNNLYKTMWIDNSLLVDLDGIDELNHIVELQLNGLNLIENISLDMKGLMYISVYSLDRLKSLDVSKCKNLKSLELSTNPELNKIDIGGTP